LNKDKNQFIKNRFRNLISNAVKFTPQGGLITIDAKEKESEIEFSVSDTGVGIEQAEINILFELKHIRTTQGTNQEKGTGFGLRICKELLNKVGGSIKAESMLNKGTTFYFTIPAKSSIDNNFNNLGQDFNKSMKVLIADDEHVNFEFLRI
jgi:signal transduction histidine kinase